jgi:hypothetical protein
MVIQKPHDGGGTFDACWTNVVANVAIAANQWVIWDTTLTGNRLGNEVILSTAASNLGVGVATQAAAVGDRILVQSYGVYKGAATDTNITAGAQLELAAAGVCRLSAVTPSATAGVLDKVGVALIADVGALGDVFIRCM